MGEEHRSRNKQITLRFDDEQMKVLLEKVKDAGTSREEYIRTLIALSVVEPKKRFEISDLDFEKLITEMHLIGDKINQVAKDVNARKRTQKKDVELLREYYFELLQLYEKIILGVEL